MSNIFELIQPRKPRNCTVYIPHMGVFPTEESKQKFINSTPEIYIFKPEEVYNNKFWSNAEVSREERYKFDGLTYVKDSILIDTTVPEKWIEELIFSGLDIVLMIEAIPDSLNFAITLNNMAEQLNDPSLKINYSEHEFIGNYLATYNIFLTVLGSFTDRFKAIYIPSYQATESLFMPETNWTALKIDYEKEK